MKKIGALILTVLILAFSLSGCGQGFLNEDEILNIENPTGTITIDIYDEINKESLLGPYTFSFELFYKHAPNTVANFITLAESGYYEGKAFEQASGNLPFVNFGEKEFIDGETENENGEAYDEPLYTKRPVNPAHYIIGEFFNNGYYFGSREDNDPRNKQTANVGSMMMIREENNDDPKSKYDTAYAGFRIQTKASSVKYEEKFCVFGKITYVSSGVAFSEALLQQELVRNIFENSGFTDNYTSKEDCKFRIVDIKINYPEGVTKDDFKVRTIKV